MLTGLQVYLVYLSVYWSAGLPGLLVYLVYLVVCKFTWYVYWSAVLSGLFTGLQAYLICLLVCRFTSYAYWSAGLLGLFVCLLVCRFTWSVYWSVGLPDLFTGLQVYLVCLLYKPKQLQLFARSSQAENTQEGHHPRRLPCAVDRDNKVFFFTHRCLTDCCSNCTTSPHEHRSITQRRFSSKRLISFESSAPSRSLPPPPPICRMP